MSTNDRRVGTVSRGIRCPIIRQGDDIAAIAAQSVLEAADAEGFALRDRDVIETTVMGMFWSGMLQAMPPKLHSRNFPGMELIRPLYRVHEDDIIAWAKHHDLQFLQCACRFTEASAQNEQLSKRKEIKALLRKLKEENPNVEKSVFNALHTVNIDTFPGWKRNGEEHSFLERY